MRAKRQLFLILLTNGSPSHGVFVAASEDTPRVSLLSHPICDELRRFVGVATG